MMKNINQRTLMNGDVVKFFVEDEKSFLDIRARTLLTKEPETIKWLDRWKKMMSYGMSEALCWRLLFMQQLMKWYSSCSI